MRGIVTYLPTADLPRGRNALRIERVEVDEPEEGEEAEPPTEYYIPFWL